MKTLSNLQEIKLKDIVIGTTNPRKTFDQKSDDELVGSIWENGLLQPILVRPTKSNKYELVCGERRFRACRTIHASHNDYDTIMAVVRELSDEEAFELQIVENLERKDVHPLEEAEAFKRMLDSGKYNISDIAGKFAKTETFIAQRLKFTDLIDEIKKDFFEGKLGIGHAVHIARLGEQDQKDIYEDSQRSWDPGYGTVAQLKDSIEGQVYDLDEAAFDTEDENLLKSAPACLTCPKRAGANPTLFPDIEDKNRCFDTGCYNQKMEAHISKSIARIIENGENVVFGHGYQSPEGFIEEILKQYEVPLLREYNDFVEDEEGAQKLFIVSGSDAGRIVQVNLKGYKTNNSNSEPSIQEQIEKIERNQKRALELDNVKIFKAVKETEFFNDYDDEHFDAELTELEKKAMWYLLKKHLLDYNSKRKYNKLIESPDSYNDIKEFEFYQDTNVEDLKLTILVRMAIKENLSNMHEPNFEKCTSSRFFFEIMKEFIPSSVNEIIEAQKEISSKRIDRSNLKLKMLKDE